MDLPQPCHRCSHVKYLSLVSDNMGFHWIDPNIPSCHYLSQLIPELGPSRCSGKRL